MIRQPMDWLCTCDGCGAEIGADHRESREDFLEFLADQGWEQIGGKWLCLDCAFKEER